MILRSGARTQSVGTAPSMRTLEVLLVEDNPSEVELTLAALRDAKLPFRPRVATNGREALDLCIGQAGKPPAMRPDLILLDLNLPLMDGREVLRALKASDATAHIPVVVLSMSQSPEDVRRSYRLHAAAYMSKPLEFEAFVAAMKALYEFWFRHVRYVGR